MRDMNMPSVGRRRRLTALSVAAAAGLSVARAGATTYTYVGPFTGTGANANPFGNPASWSAGMVPASAADTTLVFNNFDANTYSAANNLSSAFLLNSLVVNNFSTTNGQTTITSVSGDALELTGANPTITDNGPAGVAVGTLVSGSGTGLVLAPTSGTTTVAGNSDGILTIGSSTAVVTGSGGLTVNQTGTGYVSLFGTNTFTGGVTLNSGSLQVGTAGALGASTNTLTVNGGTVRGLASFANNVTLNAALNFISGTATLSGTVAGAGGVHLTNGLATTAVASQALTLSGTNTYAGPTTIDSAPVFSLSASNLATLTVSGSIAGSSSISVGNQATLAFTGSSNNTTASPTAPLTLAGGRLSVSGLAAGAAFNQTFGAVSASGLNTFSIAPQTSGTAVANTLSFGTPTLNDNATLFFRGTWLGATTSYGYGQAAFAGGLTNVSDPGSANPGTGTDLGLVPYASGNTTSATAQAPNAFVTYNAAAGSIQLVPLTSATSVVQAGAAGFSAATANQNVNLTSATSITSPLVITGTQTVNALGNTATQYLTGSGTVNVTSGDVVAVGTSPLSITLAGPTLNFGSATGYVHLGYQFGVNGTSQITGTGGVVFSGASYVGSGGIGNEVVQFSNPTVGNPFTGGLTANNVVVQFTADNELGAAGGGITLDGGTLAFNPANTTSGVVVTRPVRLGAAGGAAIGGAGGITLAGNVTGPGSFDAYSSVAGSGQIVTLTGTNTYAGPTYITNSVLNVASDANLGGGPVVSSGGTLQFAASTTLTHAIQGLAATTVDTNGNNDALSGPITGTILKVGSGTLTLTAAEPSLGSAVGASLNASAGSLVLAGNATVPQAASITAASGASVVVDNTGTNLPDRLADLARVTLPAGATFQYVGNATSPSTETFGGLNLTTAGTATVDVETPTAVLTSSGVATGPGTLAKAGAGTLVLAPALAPSNFTGGVAVNAGTLRTGSTSALGFGGTLAANVTPGSTAVAAGGSLDLGGQAVTEPVALNGGSLVNSSATPATLTSGVKGTPFSAGGTGYLPADTVAVTGGAGASASPVLGLTSASITVGNGGGDYSNLSTLPAVSITGGGGSGATALASTDPNGHLIVTVVNPGTGYTSAPTVALTGGSGTPNSAATVSGNTAAFTVVGLTQTAAGTGYNASGTAVVNSTTGSGLTLGTPVVGSLAIAGANSIGGAGDLTVQPGVTGSGSLTKVGTGTLTLAGPGSYSGGTTVSAGTLRANAAMATGPAAVVVAGGGTLGGNGSAGAVTVAAGGTITAGPNAGTTGTLTTGAQAWNASGGLTAKVSPDGASNDVLVMSGLTISASNVSGGRFNVTVTSTGTPTLGRGGVLVLADDKESAASNPFGPALGPSTLAALTLTVTGPQPATGSFALATQPDSLGNGGYDLILATVAAPEPTSLLLAGLAAAPLALGRRRRGGRPTR